VSFPLLHVQKERKTEDKDGNIKVAIINMFEYCQKHEDP